MGRYSQCQNWTNYQMRNKRQKSNSISLKTIPSEFMTSMKSKGWKKLSLRAVIELAAPQTWGASIMPILLATALAISVGEKFSFPLFYSLLGASVLLQCAVNTLNDYSDFVSGVDKKDNCIDPTDASIIYNDYDPVLAFAVGVLFMVLALACGLYAIFVAGPLLIVFGLIGAAVIFLYSFGLLPIAYTAWGELISGVIMGGLITFASYFAFTGMISLMVIVYSIPLIITIGLIMLTNNICDIEKDTESYKITLPILLGKTYAKFLHFLLFLGALLSVTLIVVFNFSGSIWLLPLFAVVLIPLEYKLQKDGLTPEKRIFSMSLTTKTNIILATFYAAMILINKIAVEATPISPFFSELFR